MSATALSQAVDAMAESVENYIHANALTDVAGGNRRVTDAGADRRRYELYFRPQRPAFLRGMGGTGSAGFGHFPAPRLRCLRCVCG